MDHDWRVDVLDLVTGAVTPLVSAAIAGAVALVVVRRQGKSAVETWVRDKRYESYSRMAEAVHEVTLRVDARESATQLLEPANRERLARELRAVELIGPASIGQLAARIVSQLGHLGEKDSDALGQELVSVIQNLNHLQGLINQNLVPAHMR